MYVPENFSEEALCVALHGDGFHVQVKKCDGLFSSHRISQVLLAHLHYHGEPFYLL